MTMPAGEPPNTNNCNHIQKELYSNSKLQQSPDNYQKYEAFNKKSAAKTNNFNEKVKTTRVNNVSTAGPKVVVSAAVGNGENVVKSLACWIWRPTGNVIEHTSKDSGSYMLKRFDYGNPQYTLQDQGIFNSGCSRHMTGNKSFLADYQRGEVDFGCICQEVLKENRVLVTKPHNKTPYELLIGRPPNLDLIRPFRCPLTILNTLDLLGKFEGKADEGFLVGYFVNSKVSGSGLEWLFDIDSLTKSMIYEPVTAGNQTNGDVDDKDDDEVPGKGDEGYLKMDVKSLNVEFEKMMHKRFKMSSMWELTFFLGLQVKKKDDGIFISQDKYVADILKKFDFVTVKITSTPIETNKALLNDEEAEDVEVHLYRSMIGSLMYLTASRPDIMFAVCACARFQVTPKVSHLNVVKRIFRYLKGQPKLGLWYPRDSPFDMEAFSDSDYAGASLDRKSTIGDSISDEFGVKTGGCQVNAAMQDLVLLGKINDVKQIHATVNGKTVVISESSVRSDLPFNDEDGITCLTNDVIFENLALMGYKSDSNKLTFQKALFSPQWKYHIHTILYCLSSKSTSWNEFSTNIASAIICLANGQKFNFSKLIFDEPFNDVYQTPSHTKKVFTNIKRKGKDFSGRVTPLFASMLAPPVVEGEGSGQPSKPQPTPSTTQPRIKERIPVTESSSP
ncbi:uncharacterized mitochondrial protein-like protein [Tanacetum coccineum]